MSVTIVTVLVVGVVVGLFGRLVVRRGAGVPPARTVLVGVLAAAAGTCVSRGIGLSTAATVRFDSQDWREELLVQVVVALVAVVVVTILSWRSRRPFGDRRRTASEDLRPIRPAVGPASPPGIDPTAPWWQATAEPASPPVGLPRPVPPSARTAAPPRAPVASGIFLSYRRADSSHAARNVAQALRSHFDGTDVFMDVDSLAAGVNFVQGVVMAIDTSGVVLVVIGDRWLSVRDERGRARLDDPRDHVRMEVEQAFRMGKVVLPVLLDGARMPSAEQLPASLGPLATVNAVRLDHDSWDADVARLVEVVARLRS